MFSKRERQTWAQCTPPYHDQGICGTLCRPSCGEEEEEESRRPGHWVPPRQSTASHGPFPRWCGQLASSLSPLTPSLSTRLWGKGTSDVLIKEYGPRRMERRWVSTWVYVRERARVCVCMCVCVHVRSCVCVCVCVQCFPLRTVVRPLRTKIWKGSLISELGVPGTLARMPLNMIHIVRVVATT